MAWLGLAGGGGAAAGAGTAGAGTAGMGALAPAASSLYGSAGLPAGASMGAGLAVPEAGAGLGLGAGAPAAGGGLYGGLGGAPTLGFMGNSGISAGGDPSGFLGGLTGRSGFDLSHGMTSNNMGSLLGQIINQRMQRGGGAGQMLSGSLAGGYGMPQGLMGMRNSQSSTPAAPGWTGKGRGARGRSG